MLERIRFDHFFKGAIKTFLIYVVLFGLLWLAGIFFPSDMCNPGLDLFVFLILLATIPVLLVRNISKAFQDSTFSINASLILHLFAAMLLIGLLNY